jgi:MFS family permease
VIGLLRPSRHRDFSLLWWGGLVSVAGDWMLMAVLPYVVYTTTGSTVATAGMTVAELAPGIVLGSWAGVMVDRWDRKRVLVLANLLQAVTVCGLLLVVADERALPVLYLVAAGQSAISAFSMPAETALLPTLVPERDLVPANALNVLNNRLGRLAGLPIGTGLYAAWGLSAVVLADAMTFLVAAALVSGIRLRAERPFAAAEASGRLKAFLDDWVAGLRLVRHDRSIGALFVVLGLMTFGGTMLDPLTAPWVRDELHGSASVYALLTTVHAASGIAGALLIGAIGSRLPARALAGATSVVAGVLLLVRFNVPVLGVALVLSLCSGVLAVASSVGVETLAQTRVPAAYRGRVFGSLQATIWLLSLLGAVVGGVGAEVVGLMPMLDVAAILVAASGVVVLLVLPAREGEPATGGDVDEAELGEIS